MLKKTIYASALLLFLAACGNNNNQSSTDNTSGNADTGTAATTDNAGAAPTLGNGISQADYENGLALVAQHDCLTCHKIDEKLVGPAYKEVANKYQADSATVKMLADKIIHGGSGNWGQVAMTPHPAVSEGDAKTMVKYVLSLK